MDKEAFVDLHFPSAGVDTSGPFCVQKPRDIGGGQYARTTPVGLNVRGFEAETLRNRGGSRAGLSKYIAQPVIAGWIVQQLAVVVWTSAAAT